MIEGMKFGRFSLPKEPYAFVIIEGNSHFQIDEVSSWDQAMQMHLADLRRLATTATRRTITISQLCAPLASGTEIWGAGVTYLPSDTETAAMAGSFDVYSKIYNSARPELFFKGNSFRVADPGGPIGIRFDADSSVPEPEIAFVLNRFGEQIGLTLCNDVTARSIEAENPLHLNQAKVYLRSSALGPFVTPIWEVPALETIFIHGRIVRDDIPIWEDKTSLGRLCRSPEELVEYLFRCQSFDCGVVLSTGAGIWPPEQISLASGDRVEIWATDLGKLVNDVAVIPMIGEAQRSTA